MQERATLMTEGSVWRHIVQFCPPRVWGNLFQQLYNVGGFPGGGQLSGKRRAGGGGFLQPPDFSAGWTVQRHLHGRQRGHLALLRRAGRTRACRWPCTPRWAFRLVAGVITTIAGVLLTPRLLVWMGTPEKRAAQFHPVFPHLFLRGHLRYSLQYGGGHLPGRGRQPSPLYYLIVSSVVNVVLDLLFVAGFGMGVDGAALGHGDFAGGQRGAGILAAGPRHRFLSRLVQEGALSCPDASSAAHAGPPLRNSEFHHRHRQRGRAVLHQPLRRHGHGRLRLLFQDRGLRLPCPSTASRWPWPPLSARTWAPGSTTRPARRALWQSVLPDHVRGGGRGHQPAGARGWISLFNSDPQVIAFGTLQARTVTLFYFLLGLLPLGGRSDARSRTRRGAHAGDAGVLVRHPRQLHHAGGARGGRYPDGVLGVSHHLGAELRGVSGLFRARRLDGTIWKRKKRRPERPAPSLDLFRRLSYNSLGCAARGGLSLYIAIIYLRWSPHGLTPGPFFQGPLSPSSRKGRNAMFGHRPEGRRVRDVDPIRADHPVPHAHAAATRRSFWTMTWNTSR